jgi:hypothetical protein
MRAYAVGYNERRVYYLELKVKAFDVLGNKCAVCGWDDVRCLQIDHKVAFKDDKNQLRGIKLLTAIAYETVEVGSYQLLCANHNWIKRIEKQENRNGKVEKMKIKGGIQNVPPNLRYLAELALNYKQNQ